MQTMKVTDREYDLIMEMREQRRVDPVKAFFGALPEKSRLLITDADIDFDAVLLEALKAAAEALEEQHEVQELSGTEARVRPHA